jgi:thiol-disulfide isomerase/thioredoxin
VRLADAGELDELVATEELVLVEFFTDGCGICASMEPVLGNVARESDAVVALVNPRDDPPLVADYDVRSVPLLVLFEDGTPVARLADGFQGTEAVLSFVEANRS